ncbi:hypothetical protein DE146DRAFT_623439 [Phaeosphaeria sp. MPI-PUGE-AT-0046c]|nr:hypothetical protein DE146DRAFT_623439 [Phaeosphaeria sp. MPI-PUGE-AT-0046c]
MPDAGTTATNCSTTKLQPCLLEERREWVKHDREVKLDVFLSLAEEVMLEVFEVGPPLPPSNMNAQEMLEKLDAHFQVYKFEPYHHAFCHFLNLHIDQYPCIEDFNQEFLTTLEDLLDHGHPLSNAQACSAYFSKLRCTQNPWVAKKLEEWDSQPKEVDVLELMQESPPWSVIRPLATKSSQNLRVESIPEEYLEDSLASDSEAPSEKSDASTVSSVSAYSRQVSTMTIDMAKSQQVTPERQKSVMTARSQEITIRASAEDISDGVCETLRMEMEKPLSLTIPERGSSKNQVPGTILSDDPNAPLPEWLASKKSTQRPSTSTPNLAIPWPSTPDIAPRPHSSRAALAAIQTPNPIASQVQMTYTASPTALTHQDPHHDDGGDNEDYEDDDADSDAGFLPLQGTSTRDSAWDYLYEAKGGYLITQQRSVEAVDRSVRTRRGHAKSSSLDLVARLGGENVTIEEQAQEGEKERRRRKKKSWSMGAGLGKLAIGGGKVKEII